MGEDVFSKYHPVVNLIFFVGAICLGSIIEHPIYLVSSVIVSGIYYIILYGSKAIKSIISMVPIALFIILINPLFNTRGETILFYLFNRPYTVQALLYGTTMALIFMVMVLWIGCYSKVLSVDKVSCLLGNIVPNIALLIVMVFRMIPNMIKKVKQVMEVRCMIGKEMRGYTKKRERLDWGINILSILTSWILEDSVTTSDSMRARGYATTKRTSFMIYRMKLSDYILSITIFVLIGIVISFLVNGYMQVDFVPECKMVSIEGKGVIGYVAYLGYISIPIVLHIKERIKWNILRYKI